MSTRADKLRLWAGRPPRLNLSRHRGLLIAVGVFVIITLLLNALSAGGLSYFSVSFLSAGGTPLALAAIGETIVILSGGFDLSAGAVVSLVNVLLASHMQAGLGSQLGWSVVALLAGAVVGGVNGFFIGLLRLPAIVVTLATMFIIEGVTLFVMSQPGGSLPNSFSMFFTGDAIPQMLPAPVVVVVVALAVWALIKYSRFGTGIYAVGSDEGSAHANGIPVAVVKLFTYVVAGMFYAASGIFVSAQTGSGDPHVGTPLLLQVFAAVVLGGTLIGGGRGGCLGTVFGAFVLMMAANILLILNVSPYYSTVVEGLILILAVLGSTLNRRSVAADYVRLASTRLRAWYRGTRASRLGLGAGSIELHLPAPGVRENEELTGPAWQRWFARHQDQVRYILPAYVLLVALLIVSYLVFSQSIVSLRYLDSLLVLASFLAILGLGQGIVILTGGLDLSLPWAIASSGILLTTLVHGSNSLALWGVPLVLAYGAFAGILNGAGVAILGISPIVVTLAMNGILQGFALVLTGGAPQGWAPPALQVFMTGQFLFMTPVVWFLILFVVASTLLLTRTTFGRRIYAVGNGARVAHMSGVGVGGTLIGAYAISGFCSALTGILLAGFNGQAFNGMGDPYLLPSIAVVVVGGTLITGGRGHYLGILGGALALTALSTLLAGTMLSDALRSIIYGLVVLGAIFALRERSV